MSEKVSDYRYELPPGLIASRPAERRDASRMLVLHRATGRIEHRMFRDFPSFLREGDLVALNDSRVIKARLLATNPDIEVFLLENLGGTRWKCLVKPGRKMRQGVEVEIAGTSARVEEVLPGGERVVVFREAPDLVRHGHMPLPPYFKRGADSADDERYQTVYAKNPGSVAAPTAGLHFTPEVLAKIPHAFLTLHVGGGTFLPVKSETVAGHEMHEETYSIGQETAAALNSAKRIVAVGTTVARVLESQPPGPIGAVSGRTAIFIHPPYEFRHTGALLTNFHLPESTLLMLVSAIAGREKILEAYAEAIRERYRFYSYGDCMLIL
ncbi:MAG: tRNA preQ1(34) S-adenosylmethionine ribosyltransferase-isomerase QueA [Verrucomicrobia bacterium]|nr:tRNA preQ1(34) S-adenosylmethionine ribosyltransferase-isomerase QueA [Verrucomicrobiota bacterium]